MPLFHFEKIFGSRLNLCIYNLASSVESEAPLPIEICMVKTTRSQIYERRPVRSPSQMVEFFAAFPSTSMANGTNWGIIDVQQLFPKMQQFREDLCNERPTMMEVIILKGTQAPCLLLLAFRDWMPSISTQVSLVLTRASRSSCAPISLKYPPMQMTSISFLRTFVRLIIMPRW